MHRLHFAGIQERQMKSEEKKEKNRRRLLLILPITGMVAGLLLLLYPYAMDRYNEYRNSQAISSMSSTYDRYEENAEELEEQLKQAEEYNTSLAGGAAASEAGDYGELLDFDVDGAMGYLEIPAIDLEMVIYHGTDDDTLAVGAGHLEGTSLPVGGESTHSVITAHSGMKTMRAFDDLRKLQEGDLFAVTVLGRTCVYEIESIETVLPEETDSLQIVRGEDRVTLVTCTPYGINDHRLLVHGVRTERTLESAAETDEEESTEDSGAAFSFDIRTTPLIVAILVEAGAAATAVIFSILRRRKEKKNGA